MRAIITLLVVSPLLTGCYIKGAIEDLESIKKLIQMSSSNEVNSGAAPRVTTSGGYQVSTSVGNMSSEIATKTDGGYQVFMTVQGSVFSEDIQYQQQQ